MLPFQFPDPLLLFVHFDIFVLQLFCALLPLLKPLTLVEELLKHLYLRIERGKAIQKLQVFNRFQLVWILERRLLIKI